MFAPRIGISNRGYTKRLQRIVTDFGIEHAFAKANCRIEEHYGFQLPVSGVRETTLRHAERAKTALEKRYEQPFRSLPAVSAAQIVAEADGTMICTVPKGPRNQSRPREWKEIRLVAAIAQGKVTACYGASFGDVDEVGRRWGHCARDAGWGLNSQIHVVADGAQWIRLKTSEIFAEQASFLLDYYHVGEYLALAGPTCRPKAPNPWRRTQQKRLKRGAAEKVLTELEDHLELASVCDEHAPVRSAHRYLGNRLDQLDYPRAISLNLPIGSGLIESGHRHVLHSRLKQPGTAWIRENADAIAQLRVVRSNGLWNQIWN